MATIRTFEDLEAWKAARELARLVYTVTSSPAFSRDVELRWQMRKAAVSAVSNIAEGFERGGRAEFINFLSIAKGSTGEVRGQSYVALDQHYVTQEQFQALRTSAERVSRLSAGLMTYLRGTTMRGVKYKPPQVISGILSLGER